MDNQNGIIANGINVDAVDLYDYAFDNIHDMEEEIKNLKEEPIVSSNNDLCETCKAKNPHLHDMEKLSLMDEQKSAADGATVVSRNDSVKRCINALVHACTCRDTNCGRGTCSKMKKVIQQTRQCKRRQAAVANCQVCEQLIVLCCFHAKDCTFVKCQIPFCLQIRQKLQEQKRPQNRQAQQRMINDE